MKQIETYLRARLCERSFWIGCGLAVTAAAALPYPYSIASFFAGVMGSLVPDGQVTH